MNVTRRSFMQTTLASAASGLLFHDAVAQNATAPAPAFVINDDTVALAGDSAPITASEKLRQLMGFVNERKNVGDTYLQGAIVKELEQAMATLTGKEDCAFLPTGTMANNLALRVLCGEKKHALVQEESHLYRDESDGPAILSGITMVPLAPDKAAPTLEEVAAAIDHAENGPYPVKVGAISLESPVRRQHGAGVPLALVKQIAEFAHSKGIGMHLDGARLLLFSGLPGFNVQEYTAPFDTVYVSLYKYLGSPFGAVLAGSKEHIAKVRDLRHIYGGMIARGWEPALHAIHALPGFTERFTAARQAGDSLLAKLKAAGFGVKPVANGSNITLVEIPKVHRGGLRERLQKANILASITPDGAEMTFFINESVTRQPVEKLAAVFLARA